MEKIRQDLWFRWQKEYLLTCQQRSKWKTKSKAKFEVGKLVLLKEGENMRLKWTLARITEVHPGPDGIIRAVIYFTYGKGVYKRSIVNIANY